MLFCFMRIFLLPCADAQGLNNFHHTSHGHVWLVVARTANSPCLWPVLAGNFFAVVFVVGFLDRHTTHENDCVLCNMSLLWTMAAHHAQVPNHCHSIRSNCAALLVVAGLYVCQSMLLSNVLQLCLPNACNRAPSYHLHSTVLLLPTSTRNKCQHHPWHQDTAAQRRRRSVCTGPTDSSVWSPLSPPLKIRFCSSSVWPPDT